MTGADSALALMQVTAERDLLLTRLTAGEAKCREEMEADDLSAWGSHDRHFAAKSILAAMAAEAAIPTVTPPEARRETCSQARFGQPHTWSTGAFYWPLGSPSARLYVGDDYVMCGGCGQIEED